MTVVLCATCGIPAEAPKTPRPADEVRCPSCGQVDTVERALSDARQHATHHEKRALEQRLTEKGHAIRNRTPTRMPVKRLRWVSGDAPPAVPHPRVTSTSGPSSRPLPTSHP